MAKQTVWIKLEVDGPNADAAATAVDVLLDVGTIQELIVEAAADVGYAFEITSASSEVE